MAHGRDHHYAVRVQWTGNTGAGTASYQAYSRAHDIIANGKPAIAGSSDPTFRGDPARWNPEEMLVASLSTCHMLWYLGLCAQAGIVVTGYSDHAEGRMVEDTPGGAGRFASVKLRPEVTLAPGSDITVAERLHHEAHAKCYIAASVNFLVTHEPRLVTG